MPPGADDLATQLAGVRAGLSSALEELREITGGLHPATLAEGGLTSALKGLARRSAIPVRLHVGLERRLPETVELAVYFAVAEVLTNTAKHAGASVVDLTLTADENRLRVEIHDDGAGGARVGSGSGLVGLIDRVVALGGRLRLHSPPGAGTTVTITLPLGLPGPIQPARPSAGGLRPNGGPGTVPLPAARPPQPRSRIRRDPSGTPFRWQTPRISRHPAPCRRPSPGAPVPACSGPGSSRRRSPSR